MLTTSAEEIVGRASTTSCRARSRPRSSNARRAPATPGPTAAVEYQLEVGSGLRDFEGRVVYAGEDEFILIVRDFTERKRQEEELLRVSAELEHRLGELERERDFIRAVVNTAPSMLCLTDPEGRIVVMNRALQRASGCVRARARKVGTSGRC